MYIRQIIAISAGGSDNVVLEGQASDASWPFVDALDTSMRTALMNTRSLPVTRYLLYQQASVLRQDALYGANRLHDVAYKDKKSPQSDDGSTAYAALLLSAASSVSSAACQTMLSTSDKKQRMPLNLAVSCKNRDVAEILMVAILMLQPLEDNCLELLPLNWQHRICRGVLAESGRTELQEGSAPLCIRPISATVGAEDQVNSMYSYENIILDASIVSPLLLPGDEVVYAVNAENRAILVLSGASAVTASDASVVAEAKVDLLSTVLSSSMVLDNSIEVNNAGASSEKRAGKVGNDTASDNDKRERAAKNPSTPASGINASTWQRSTPTHDNK